MSRVFTLIARERMDSQYVLGNRLKKDCKTMNDNLLLQDCVKGKVMALGVGGWLETET